MTVSSGRGLSWVCSAITNKITRIEACILSLDVFYFDRLTSRQKKRELIIILQSNYNNNNKNNREKERQQNKIK
jgi:hypothetical protein